MVLPRQLFTKMYELTGVSVRRKRREVYRGLRPLFDRYLAIRVHIRHDRTRMRRVDLDRRVLQFIRQMNGVTVERGF